MRVLFYFLKTFLDWLKQSGSCTHKAVHCDVLFKKSRYPFKLEVARQNSSLVGVHALAAVEELRHEG